MSASADAARGATIRVLAFDVTGDACSAAIWRDGAALASEQMAMTRGHAEALIPMIERVRAAAGLDWFEIDRIATSAGPGSFTGVRVGVAAARALAVSLGTTATLVDGYVAAAATARAERPKLAGEPALRVCFGRAPRLTWRMVRLPPRDGGRGPGADEPEDVVCDEIASGDLAALSDAEAADPAPRVGPATAEADLGGAPLAPRLDPMVIARLAARGIGARDGVLYARPPDAALPSAPPPRRLGPRPTALKAAT